jgi:hypothetical protein
VCARVQVQCTAQIDTLGGFRAGGRRRLCHEQEVALLLLLLEATADIVHATDEGDACLVISQMSSGFCRSNVAITLLAASFGRPTI